MIFTEFAPNETSEDAVLSLSLLLQPFRWIKGKASQKINTMLRSYFPGSRIFLFFTARSALSVFLSAVRIKKGDEVLITGFTCEATVLPILKSGAEPVYVDIERNTLSMDLNDLKKKLTPRTKLIILQHSFGMMPTYRSEVLALAKKQRIRVVEDIAHGFSPQNSHLITPSAKTALILSFGRSKALSSVFGGALILPDKRLAYSVNTFIEKSIPYPSLFQVFSLLLYKPIAVVIKAAYSVKLGKPTHWIARKLRLLGAEISEKEKRGEYDIVFEKRYPDALAQLLIPQLQKLSQTQRYRSAISHLYYSKLKNHAEIPPEFQTATLRFPLMVKNRSKVLISAKKNGILLGQWYTQPIAPNQVSLKQMKYVTGTCPKSEKVCSSILNLPTQVTQSDAEKIIHVIKPALTP